MPRQFGIANNMRSRFAPRRRGGALGAAHDSRYVCIPRRSVPCNRTGQPQPRTGKCNGLLSVILTEQSQRAWKVHMSGAPQEASRMVTLTGECVLRRDTSPPLALRRRMRNPHFRSEFDACRRRARGVHASGELDDVVGEGRDLDGGGTSAVDGAPRGAPVSYTHLTLPTKA